MEAYVFLGERKRGSVHTLLHGIDRRSVHFVDILLCHFHLLFVLLFHIGIALHGGIHKGLGHSGVALVVEEIPQAVGGDAAERNYSPLAFFAEAQ